MGFRRYLKTEEVEEVEGDFPEEKQLKGENSIGRKAAYRFIKGQLDAIVRALDDLEETPAEEAIAKEKLPILNLLIPKKNILIIFSQI